MGQNRALQVAVGVLVSAYGASSLLGLWGSGAEGGRQVHVVTVWPTWMVTTGAYVSGATLAAMIAGGLGTALGNRLSMRVLLVALVAQIAQEVVFKWSTLTMVGLGRIPVRLELPSTREADGERYLRIGALLGLSGSVISVLIALAVVLWLRGAIARTADDR